MSKRNIIFIGLFLLTASTIYVACSSGSDDENEMEVVQPEPESTDKVAMLTNIFDNAAIPAYDEFEVQTNKLVETATLFQNNVNTTNLEAMQMQWLNTKMAWEATEVFDIGSISDLFLHNKVDKYPSKQAFLEDVLNEDATLIDEAFIEGAGSTRKGLPALEYLLFRPENGTDILTQFTEGARAAQYINFAVALSQNLDNQAALLKTELADTRTEFINNTIDGINGSINDLANAQVTILEEILRNKIFKPLGNEDAGIAQPDKVETPYAKVSLAAIRQNLIGVRNSFVADTTKENLYTLLDESHAGTAEKLSITISNAIDDSLTEIDNIQGNITEIVVSDPDLLTPLSDAITRIAVAVKVDMANQLGLTIVFNDVDGD